MPIFISINIVADATYKVLDYLQHYSAANTGPVVQNRTKP